MKRNAMIVAAALLPLLAARAVTFTEDTHIADGDATYEGQPVTVSGCALTVDGAHVFTNLYLVNSATLTHTAGSAGMMLTVSGTVSVATGSKIDVSGRGSGVRAGTMDRAGGSYGGRGEFHSVNISCAVYGDAFAPADSGSGGAGSSACRGGGAVRITADTLQLDGALRANGQNGANYTGGGSGGSVWLDVGTLQGEGTIQANGGLHANSSGDSGDGGGGRVAVYYDDASGFDLTFIQCAAINDGAGAGTVYLKDKAEPFGRLKLDNGEHAHSSAIPTALTAGSDSFDRLSVSGEARLDLTATNLLTLSSCVVSNAFTTFGGDVAGPDLTLIDGDWTHGGSLGFSNSVVLSGASTLRHAIGYSTGLRITADAVAISSSSAIDVSARGSGVRAGTMYRAGGSYGGRGEPFSGNMSCGVYGDAFAPADLGSGGNGGKECRGGGAMQITADTLQLDGTLLANGQNGADYTGGGSGGAVWLDVGTLQGTGSIQANGGLRGRDAGDGGGGHGTVMGFASEFEAAGLSAASAMGAASATFGLVAGGLLGGPLGYSLLRGRRGRKAAEVSSAPGAAQASGFVADARALARYGWRAAAHVLLLLACVKAGTWVSLGFSRAGITFPVYMGAMVLGVAVRNLIDVFGNAWVRTEIVDVVASVSLGVFLTMAMMSLNLIELSGVAGAMLAVLAAQVALVAVFARAVTFRAMGGDYDAAVMAAGQCGFGLGAMPTAVANMKALVEHHGPAPRAFLVVPITGTFLIDLVNATNITVFINLLK